MLTEWILFLMGNLLVCLGFVLIGKSIAANPPGDRQAVLAYRTESMPSGDEAWNLAQKTYGRILTRGGYALMIINIVAMLCVISLDRTALNVAGTLMMVLEGLFWLGARLYTRRTISRLPSSDSAQHEAEAEDASAGRQSSEPDTEDCASEETESSDAQPEEAEETSEALDAAASDAPAQTDEAPADGFEQADESVQADPVPEEESAEKMQTPDEEVPADPEQPDLQEISVDDALRAVRHYRHAAMPSREQISASLSRKNQDPENEVKQPI